MKRELRRCPLLTLPNNKLIPDARWILDSVGQHDIVARSQARADVAEGLARAREPDQARQRRGLPARQRRLLRGDRRRRRRSARPVARSGLQAHLHESLLRGLWQLLSSRAGGRGRRSGSCSPARLGLRLWGVQQGLPYAYNTDEADHFVPRAVAMFGHRPEPALLRKPAGVHLRAALPVRDRLRRQDGRPRTPSRCTRRGVYTLARVAAARARRGRPVAALRDAARACSDAPSACSRRRSRRSRSCPSSTRTSRSTTCRRSRR